MLEADAEDSVYVGDSATLSFLQLLRMIVETTAGPSPFSLDPGRHRIHETEFKPPSQADLTHLLPPKGTALILVDSFFTNTIALLDIFDEESFLSSLDKCYTDPLVIGHTWLCQLYLVLAIGECLATPKPGSWEAEVIESLRLRNPDQSEVFYFTAKSLSNPLAQLEDAELWSIQALALMATYMLLRSRRNTAFAYAGMAVRSAYSLGMHREETLVIFPPVEQMARRKLWRSLFILDRFLAVSFGRPVAISEEECSGEILAPSSHAQLHPSQPDPHHVCAVGLEATVRSCHVMGTILRTVYQQRKISTKLAQELADKCKEWSEHLAPNLHWRQASPDNVRQAIAILHCNVVHCHSIILLTRPFFLYLLSGEIQRTRLNSDAFPPRTHGRMEKFSDACMVASTHTVALVQHAYEGGYLPRLNPFSTYCIFAAALIIFANEYARPGSNALWVQCMQHAISILQHCGEMDPQAKRAAYVLVEFRNVIQAQGNPPVPFAPQEPNFHSESPPDGFSHSPTLSSGDVQRYPSVPTLPAATAAPAFGPMPSLAAMSRDPTSSRSGAKSSTLASAHIPDEDPLTGLLDLTNTMLPTSNDAELSSADDGFDFDRLWHLPATTPLPSPGALSPSPMQTRISGAAGGGGGGGGGGGDVGLGGRARGGGSGDAADG
ncbi:MAG: hypothetical protein Q9163_002990 [Psora crenata]